MDKFVELAGFGFQLKNLAESLARLQPGSFEDRRRYAALYGQANKNKNVIVVARNAVETSLNRAQNEYISELNSRYYWMGLEIISATKDLGWPNGGDNATHAEMKTLHYAYDHFIDPIALGVAPQAFCAARQNVITIMGGGIDPITRRIAVWP